MTSTVLRAAIGLVLGGGLAAPSVLLFRAHLMTRPKRVHSFVVAASVLVVCSAVAVWPWTGTAAGALIALVGVPAAAVDAVEHRIPDRFSAVLAAGTVVALVAAALTTDSFARLSTAIAGAAVWGGLLLLSFLLVGDPGPGDVKLAPSLGMLLGWFGWKWLLVGIVGAYLLAALAGALGLLVKRWRHRDGRVPLAPPMLASTVISVTVAALTL